MENKDTLLLGAKIGYLGKLFKEEVRVNCLKKGISETYSKIIMVLSRFNNGVTQNEIAEKTYLKKSTISITLKKMEKEGYISRNLCLDDNRKIIVNITQRGKQLDSQIRESFMLVEELMIKNLKNTEIELFDKTLEKIKDNLRRGE